MKQIKAEAVALAFNIEAARNVTVRRLAPKEWFFTFEAYDEHSGLTETYALLTKRGELRTWADPRLLFAHLQETYGVTNGRFELNSEEKIHEKEIGVPGNDSS